jgi:hypothetical protein
MLLLLLSILFTRNINVVGLQTEEQIIEKTFCTFGGAYIVGEIWKSHGWKQSTNRGKCNIVWLNLVEDYCTILLDDKMESNVLTARQIVNFFQGEDIFVDKGLLPRYLQRYEDKVCSNARQGNCREKWDVVPELLTIDSTKDAFELENRFLEDYNMKVIVKPSDGAGGSGIRVLQHDEFMEFLHAPEDIESIMVGEDIMQVYFESPYLLYNHKSEVALYWMLVSIDPLVVYYFDEWQIRLSSEPFDHGKFNPYKHVTNIDAQKSHKTFNKIKKSLKWTMKNYRQYMDADRGSGASDHLLDQMKRSIVRVLNATVPTMRGDEPYLPLPDSLLLGYYLEEGCPAWKSNASSIGLYRSDFMVNELTLEPIMTEVQSNFGVSFENSVKKYIIPPMFREMADVAEEVIRLRSNGRSIDEVVSNISPQHFHLLINEATKFYDDQFKRGKSFYCKTSDRKRCDKCKCFLNFSYIFFLGSTSYICISSNKK